MAGEIVHIEFPSTDVDRAQRFWSGLFGWEFGESQMPDLDYRMARTGENSGAAVWPSDQGTGHARYYFGVDDMEAAGPRSRSSEAHPRRSNRFPAWAGSPSARTAKATSSASGRRTLRRRN